MKKIVAKHPFASIGAFLLAIVFAPMLFLDFTEPEAKSKPGAVGHDNTQHPQLALVAQQRENLQRIPVAGQTGYSIVVAQDGSSYLEGPGGKKIRELLPPGESPAAIPVDIVKKLSVTPKQSLGQLIVCDKGVIDVPKDAIITFIGDDRVVTHSPNGVSVVYHVDGRIERREDFGRPGVASKTNNEKKGPL